MRRAARQLEQSINATRLRLGEIRPELENSPLRRYGNIALQLESLLDRLYVPNVRGARISVPRAYRDTDYVPLVALDRNIRPVLDKGFEVMSPRQLTSLARQLEERDQYTPAGARQFAEDLNNGTRSSKPKPKKSLAETGDRAVVLARAGGYKSTASDRSRYIWAQRPLIVTDSQVSIDPAYPLARTCACHTKSRSATR